MRNLRHVNIDHLHVGWYQSTYFGSFINRLLLDSQFNYQHSIEESVVLIYGEWLCGNHFRYKIYARGCNRVFRAQRLIKAKTREVYWQLRSIKSKSVLYACKILT